MHCWLMRFLRVEAKRGLVMEKRRFIKTASQVQHSSVPRTLQLTQGKGVKLISFLWLLPYCNFPMWRRDPHFQDLPVLYMPSMLIFTNFRIIE